MLVPGGTVFQADASAGVMVLEEGIGFVCSIGSRPVSLESNETRKHFRGWCARWLRK